MNRQEGSYQLSHIKPQRYLAANESQRHHSEEGNSSCRNVNNNYTIELVFITRRHFTNKLKDISNFCLLVFAVYNIITGGYMSPGTVSPKIGAAGHSRTKRQLTSHWRLIWTPMIFIRMPPWISLLRGRPAGHVTHLAPLSVRPSVCPVRARNS